MDETQLKTFFEDMARAVHASDRDAFVSTYYLPTIIYKHDGLEIPRSAEELWQSAISFWASSQALGAVTAQVFIEESGPVSEERCEVLVRFEERDADDHDVRTVRTRFFLWRTENGWKVEMFESVFIGVEGS